MVKILTNTSLTPIEIAGHIIDPSETWNAPESRWMKMAESEYLQTVIGTGDIEVDDGYGTLSIPRAQTWVALFHSDNPRDLFDPESLVQHEIQDIAHHTNIEAEGEGIPDESLIYYDLSTNTWKYVDISVLEMKGYVLNNDCDMILTEDLEFIRYA